MSKTCSNRLEGEGRGWGRDSGGGRGQEGRGNRTDK